MKERDKIAYWIEAANYDMKSAIYMQKSGRYVYTAFLCQQAIEKYLKALYIGKMSNEAPRTHNLVYLAGLLEIKINDKDMELLTGLTSFYIEGRYPTYKQTISRIINRVKADTILKETRRFIKWLKSNPPS